MNKLVYLAGGIKGLSYEETVFWRNQVIRYFKDFGLVGLSPMRGKEYLSQETAIKGCHEQYPLSTSKGIVTRDRNDVARSAACLFYLPDNNISIGTIMEIAWADAFRKPIVLVTPKDSIYEQHPMIKECCGFIVRTLDEGCDLIRQIILS